MPRVSNVLVLDKEVFSVKLLLAAIKDAVVWSILKVPPPMVVHIAGGRK